MSISWLKGIHRRMLGISVHDQIMAKNGYVAGGDNKPAIVLPGNPDTVAIWDDFLGDTGKDFRLNQYDWRVLDGDTGTDTGSNVKLQAATSGVLRITNGDTPITQTKMGITGALQWKGNQGSGPNDNKNGLRLGCRLKIGDISGDTGTAELKDTGNSNVNVWIGFTDTLAAEVPVMDTGGALVSVAANAFGVGFGSRTTGGGDTGWVAYAVNGGTDLTPVVLDTGVTPNVYDVIEMELHHGHSDTGGTASFYVNGIPAGSIAAPVAMNVALAPQILVWGDSGGGVQVDVDWVNVSAPRDTGI